MGVLYLKYLYDGEEKTSQEEPNINATTSIKTNGQYGVLFSKAISTGIHLNPNE